MSGLPYLRKLSLDDFKISVILSFRVLKYGNISQKSWELNTRTFSFQASCATDEWEWAIVERIQRSVKIEFRRSGWRPSEEKKTHLACQRAGSLANRQAAQPPARSRCARCPFGESLEFQRKSGNLTQRY